MPWITSFSVTSVSFILLALLMTLVASLAMKRHLEAQWPSIGFILLYVAVPGFLAGTGLLYRFESMPPPAMLLVAVLTLATIAFALSPLGARLAAGLGVTTLIVMQGFRVPVELILHRLYLEGVIPVQMTYAGLNFDIVSGATAILLGFWLLQGRSVPPWLLLAWNVLGLALLAVIVTIALLSAPVPFRRFTEGPANRLPGMFPYVWLPTLLVQIALSGHLLLFLELKRRTP